MESDPQTTLLDPLSTYEPKGIHNGGGLQTAPSTFPQHPRSFPPTHRETVVRKQQRRRRGRPCEDAAHPAWAWHEDEGFDYCEAGGAEEGEGTGENSYWGHAEEVDEEANRRGRVAGLLGGVKPWTASLYHGPGLFCLWRRRRGRWEGKPGALGVEEEEAKGAEVEEGKMNEAEEAGREDGQPQEGPRWAWPGMRGGGEKRVRFSRTSASSLPERPSAASWQALQRMSTVSVDFLKKQDRRCGAWCGGRRACLGVMGMEGVSGGDGEGGRFSLQAAPWAVPYGLGSHLPLLPSLPPSLPPSGPCRWPGPSSSCTCWPASGTSCSSRPSTSTTPSSRSSTASAPSG